MATIARSARPATFLSVQIVVSGFIAPCKTCLYRMLAKFTPSILLTNLLANFRRPRLQTHSLACSFSQSGPHTFRTKLQLLFSTLFCGNKLVNTPVNRNSGCCSRELLMLALGIHPRTNINNSLVQHNRCFRFTGVLTITWCPISHLC